jgi:hypothetical protein
MVLSPASIHSHASGCLCLLQLCQFAVVSLGKHWPMFMHAASLVLVPCAHSKHMYCIMQAASHKSHQGPVLHLTQPPPMSIYKCCSCTIVVRYNGQQPRKPLHNWTNHTTLQHLCCLSPSPVECCAVPASDSHEERGVNSPLRAWRHACVAWLSRHSICVVGQAGTQCCTCCCIHHSAVGRQGAGVQCPAKECRQGQ